MKIRFPEETLDDIVSTFLSGYTEKIATLCVDKDNNVYLGEPVKEGSEYSCPTISKKEMSCPSGCKPVGTIHSHVYEYDERPPFDKGFSNEDVFSFTKEALNKQVDLPYLGCVISPTYGDDDYLTGFRIDCEYYKPFTEDDIKKLPNGFVVHEDGKEKHETFDDKQIEWFKKGSVPRGHMLGSIGFMVAMANLKIGFKEKGFMSDDSFLLPVTENKKHIELEEKTMTF